MEMEIGRRKDLTSYKCVETIDCDRVQVAVLRDWYVRSPLLH